MHQQVRYYLSQDIISWRYTLISIQIKSIIQMLFPKSH